MIQCTPLHPSVKRGGGSVWAYMAANGTGSCDFWWQDDFWSAQKHLLRSHQMPRKSLDGASLSSTTMTGNILLKQTKELFFRARKWNFPNWPPVLNSNEHAFHSLKTRLKAKRTETNRSCRWQQYKPGRASPGKMPSIWWSLWVADFRQSLNTNYLLNVLNGNFISVNVHFSSYFCSRKLGWLC